MKCFCLFLLVSACFLSGSSYRILTVLLIAGRSNMNYFDPIHLELAKKGHSITVISPTTPLVHHKNIKEIAGLDFAKLVQGLMKEPDFFEMRLSGERMGSPFLKDKKFAADCDAFYQLPVVQNIIHGSERFDLVMTMAFMNECVYGIFHHLNASTAIISTVPTMPWFVALTGAPTLLSFTPHIYWTGAAEMNFLERVGNLGTFIYQMLTRNYVYLPAIEEVYRKYIPNAPTVNEIKQNVSLVMGAGTVGFGPIRPSMPDLIDDIGGIHCRPALPLPKEIASMIVNDKGEERDFIFFSLGSIVQGHKVPTQMREAFLKTFAKLEQYTVLWKWEVELNETMEVPPNVKVAKWFPQQDLLGHPKCKLFITHGGLSSLHEALYHGVPVIGIPFFGDQDWNMKQVEYDGIGVKLELSDITKELFTETLQQVLNEPRFGIAVQKRSLVFRDRQNSALDTAVWWLEYVLRHGGATHLRSPARQLNLIQYYCIDIIAFILISLSVVLYTVYSIIKNFKNLLFNKPKNTVKSKVQ